MVGTLAAIGETVQDAVGGLQLLLRGALACHDAAVVAGVVAPVECHVRLHRVNIAPEPLDRLRFLQRSPTAIGKEPVDGAHGQTHHVRQLESSARPAKASIAPSKTHNRQRSGRPPL